jgi:hypothetical protein
MGQADDHTDGVQREHGMCLLLHLLRRCRLRQRREHDTGPGRRLRLLILILMLMLMLMLDNGC